MQTTIEPSDLVLLGIPIPTSAEEWEHLKERLGRPEARQARILGRRSELTVLGRKRGFKGAAMFVAVTCGVDRKTVGDLARGVTKPHAATLAKIAGGLRVSEAEVRRLFEIDD